MHAEDMGLHSIMIWAPDSHISSNFIDIIANKKADEASVTIWFKAYMQIFKIYYPSSVGSSDWYVIWFLDLMMWHPGIGCKCLHPQYA